MRMGNEIKRMALRRWRIDCGNVLRGRYADGRKNAENDAAGMGIEWMNAEFAEDWKKNGGWS